MHNRREFLKKAAIAGIGFPTILPSIVFGKNAPSKRITLGCIGMGNQGVNANLRSFLNENDAHVIAVCDAYLGRAKRAAGMVNKRYKNSDCKVYQDFRKIIADPTIDAVVISTPDHWHVPMSLMAVAAGKDVFSEKPTLYIDEGQKLVEEFAKRKKVFQAGIEDRSLIHFHKMVEWVKNGAIGKLGRVEVVMPAGKVFPKEKASTPPADLNWNLWQGPAASHNYTPNRTGAWHWRNIGMYAKGALLDMGAHLVDTAQIGVNDPNVCPLSIEGTGEIPVGMETDVPIKFDLTYRYSNGVELSVKDGKRSGWVPAVCSIRFEGDKGWIRRKTWNAPLEASDKSILRIKYPKGTSKHWPLPPREQRNFLDCVKSRKPTTYQASDMHQISTTLHMGIIAITLGRKLNWDPKAEVFKNDEDANKLCKRPKKRNWQNA